MLPSSSWARARVAAQAAVFTIALLVPTAKVLAQG
jgi:hypothetical protein